MRYSAPFPYFGGKSRAAEEVWRRFGDVRHYVEPFAGSLAVLLARPHAPRVETVNDADGFVSNFWRSLRWAPGAVADWADWPVQEPDLHARRRWLVERQDTLLEDLEADPLFFDAQAAGFWLYGQCAWIGGGWPTHDARIIPHVGDTGRGIHSKSKRHDVHAELEALSERLRYVRVCAGDWSRVCTDCVLMGQDSWDPVGVFLDPPYRAEGRASRCYAQDNPDVVDDVLAWAVEYGAHERLRIAVCGYEGDWTPPDSWSSYRWRAVGGYGRQGGDGETDGQKNKHRERIWFSPGCVGGQDGPQFEGYQPGIFQLEGAQT